MTAVAGEFYDYMEVDAKRLGILVADVTGHGVPGLHKNLIAAHLRSFDDRLWLPEPAVRHEEQWTSGPH
jgi:serine phosphatase RsbU (regulator of sigma subunit)